VGKNHNIRILSLNYIRFEKRVITEDNSIVVLEVTEVQEIKTSALIVSVWPMVDKL
jgi:hypothetical protein